MKLPPGIAHFISHNDHKTIYASVQDYLLQAWPDDELLPDELLEECVRTDELWELRWYPQTPVAHCAIFAPTLERLMQLAEEASR